MVGDRTIKRLVAALGASGAAVWVVGSWWTGGLIGIPGTLGQWRTWTWPADPVPSFSIVGPFMGGAGMFVLAVGLLFAIGFIGAWQRPLVLQIPPDESPP